MKYASVKTKSATLVPNDPAYSFLGKPIWFASCSERRKRAAFFGIEDELKGVFVNKLEVYVNLSGRRSGKVFFTHQIYLGYLM